MPEALYRAGGLLRHKKAKRARELLLTLRRASWAGSTRCPPTGSRSSGWGSPSPCPARETASTTRRPRTSSRWSRPSFTAIGRETTPISSRGIWRSISTGTTTCASRDAWTEAVQSSTGSAGPLIHFFCRSGNGVPCSFGAQFNTEGPFSFASRFLGCFSSKT